MGILESGNCSLEARSVSVQNRLLSAIVLLTEPLVEAGGSTNQALVSRCYRSGIHSGC